MGLKLEDLAVGREGSGPEVPGTVDVAEEKVGVDVPRVLAHQVLQVGLGPLEPASGS